MSVNSGQKRGSGESRQSQDGSQQPQAPVRLSKEESPRQSQDGSQQPQAPVRLSKEESPRQSQDGSQQPQAPVSLSKEGSPRQSQDGSQKSQGSARSSKEPHKQPWSPPGRGMRSSKKEKALDIRPRHDKKKKKESDTSLRNRKRSSEMKVKKSRDTDDTPICTMQDGIDKLCDIAELKCEMQRRHLRCQAALKEMKKEALVGFRRAMEDEILQPLKKKLGYYEQDIEALKKEIQRLKSECSDKKKRESEEAKPIPIPFQPKDETPRASVNSNKTEEAKPEAILFQPKVETPRTSINSNKTDETGNQSSWPQMEKISEDKTESVKKASLPTPPPEEKTAAPGNVVKNSQEIQPGTVNKFEWKNEKKEPARKSQNSR